MLRRTVWLAALLLPLWAGAATVVTAEIRGAISPASSAYFLRALDEARRQQAQLLVLSLDTPGGLDAAMRDMIRGILASPVPVAIYVSPSGARAASAGTYLLYASHIAAMAPGTNLGAATPVAIGLGGERDKPGDEPQQDKRQSRRDPMEAKAVSDSAAYLRSLAQLRGRNPEWAEKAVREAASLSADEALQLKVIDLVATDLPDLLRQAEGRKVQLENRTHTVSVAGAAAMAVERNWKERLLAVIADPNIALILMMVGIYGLLFEFYSPGMAAPGVLGGICLLLGLYGLALLPLNFVGVALLLLGLALMVAEAFLPSFGVLGIGGIAAFVAGALMLVDADVPQLTVSWALVVPLAVASALVIAGIGTFAYRAHRRRPASGEEAMIGAEARALEDIEREGWVWVFGERWRARTSAPLARGQRVTIVGRDGLTLLVQPQDKGGGP